MQYDPMPIWGVAGPDKKGVIRAITPAQAAIRFAEKSNVEGMYLVENGRGVWHYRVGRDNRGWYAQPKENREWLKQLNESATTVPSVENR